MNHTQIPEYLHQRENWPRCFDGIFLWYRHQKEDTGVHMVTYRVVLNGALKGLEASEVAPQLAHVCKIPVEGALALLANPGTVIKGALDLEMATAYKSTLRGVGCQVLLEQESDATVSKRSFVARLLGKHGHATKSAHDVRQLVGVLGRQARDAVEVFTKIARGYAGRAGLQIKPAAAGAGNPVSSLLARWQRGANWLSIKMATVAHNLGAPSWAKKFLGVNTLIVASVVITAAAIAGVLVSGGHSTQEPCPKDFQATSSMSCVGEMSFPNGEKYVGEVKDGQPHGRGMFTWPNGEKYVGGWTNGQRNGEGAFTWPDGTKYVGQFRNNNKHGTGTYTYANGRTVTGQWKDGNPVQEPVATAAKPASTK